MEEHIAKAIAFIGANSAWAGPAIGVLAFGESLALIGVLIPGTAILLGIGGLIGTGTIHPVSALSWMIAGAIAGNWVSYWLGQKIGPRVYHRWPLKQNRPMVAKARLFFRKHGVAAIFLSRFLGPLRAVMPVVAGVVDMGQRKFQIANVLSALVWAPAILAPGYFAGESLGPDPVISSDDVLVFLAGTIIITALAAWASTKMLGRRKPKRRIPPSE